MNLLHSIETLRYYLHQSIVICSNQTLPTLNLQIGCEDFQIQTRIVSMKDEM